MGSGAVKYVSRFIKIGSGLQNSIYTYNNNLLGLHSVVNYIMLKSRGINTSRRSVIANI
jgi:hypothetical protein